MGITFGAVVGLAVIFTAFTAWTEYKIKKIEIAAAALKGRFDSMESRLNSPAPRPAP